MTRTALSAAALSLALALTGAAALSGEDSASSTEIYAADFGAAADGKADDFEKLQAALTNCGTTGRTLHLRPRATYVTSRELVMERDCTVEGHGAMLVTTNEPLRSIITVKGGAVVHMKDLTLNASRVATHALYAAGAGQSRFEDCTFMMAVKDAVLLDAIGAAGGNDSMKFDRCRFQHSGRILDVGTVTVSKGTSPIVTGENTDFDSLRPGDFIHVGDEWLPVQEVLSKTKVQCALHPPSVGHDKPTAYTAHVGDGYREETFNDNNLAVHRDCLYRGNAGSGARFAGLYGPRVENGQSDFNRAFGFVVGMATGSNVIGSSFRGCYTEDLGAESFFLGYAAGIEITTLNCDPERASFRLSNPSFNWGTISNVQGRDSVEAVGGGTENKLVSTRLLREVIPETGPVIPNSDPAYTWRWQLHPKPGEAFVWVKFGASAYSEWVPLRSAP